jgi:hypothetical protein
MHIILDAHTRITHDQFGHIHITKPSITGRVSTHVINTDYDLFDIARWLYKRLRRDKTNPSVQVAFPDMREDDREFLMTGISPSEWKEIFPKESEEQDG